MVIRLDASIETPSDDLRESPKLDEPEERTLSPTRGSSCWLPNAVIDWSGMRYDGPRIDLHSQYLLARRRKM